MAQKSQKNIKRTLRRRQKLLRQVESILQLHSTTP